APRQLADRGPRNRVDEIDRGHLLHRAHLVLGPGDELFCGDVVPVAQGDLGVWSLAPFRVRHADDGCFSHRGVLLQRVLQLLGPDVVAAGDDRVFLAVGEVKEAVLRHPANITRAHPTVRAHPLGGRFRRAPQFAHGARTATYDLADFTRRQLVAVVVHDDDLGVRRWPP